MLLFFVIWCGLHAVDCSLIWLRGVVYYAGCWSRLFCLLFVVDVLVVRCCLLFALRRLLFRCDWFAVNVDARCCLMSIINCCYALVVPVLIVVG